MREISSANDEAHPDQGWVFEIASLQQHLERAARSAVAELSARHVERDLGDAAHVLGAGDEAEGRLRIDEATDRPRGRDAVDVQALAGYVADLPTPY